MQVGLSMLRTVASVLTILIERKLQNDPTVDTTAIVWSIRFDRLTWRDLFPAGEPGESELQEAQPLPVAEEGQDDQPLEMVPPPAPVRRTPRLNWVLLRAEQRQLVSTAAHVDCPVACRLGLLVEAASYRPRLVVAQAQREAQQRAERISFL